jgi:hypothetical protein
MTCTTGTCPVNASCCDGLAQTCDGTRLPAGDGTNYDGGGNSQYVVSGDGLTVTDTITGLVWQQRLTHPSRPIHIGVLHGRGHRRCFAELELESQTFAFAHAPCVDQK